MPSTFSNAENHYYYDEDLTGYAPVWYDNAVGHGTGAAVHQDRTRQHAIHAKGKARADLIPLNESDDGEPVYGTWINPSTLLRLIAFTYKKATVKCIHILFRSWPDNGVPSDLVAPGSAMDDWIGMLGTVYDVQRVYDNPELTLYRGTAGPFNVGRQANARRMLVHCLAGIGRTGTFITLYTYLNPLHPAAYSVIHIINAIRRNRAQNSVYTEAQLAFIYRVIGAVHRNEHDYLAVLYDPSASARANFIKYDTAAQRYGAAARSMTIDSQTLAQLIESLFTTK